MTDAYREAVERRMQAGSAGQQGYKDFLRGQATKDGGNTASVGELQQRQYAKTSGLNSSLQSRMTDEYREAVEQRMQRGMGQSLKDSLGKISGRSQKAGMDNEDKSFWEGFRKGLGLKDGEEVGGGRPGDIGFSAMDTAEHTVYKKDYNAAGYQQRSGLHEADLGLKLAAISAPAHRSGLYQDDNEYSREELEEDKSELQEEILELLRKHGYDEDELTDELLNDLLYNGTGLGEDHDRFVQLAKEIHRIDERIIYLYTSEDVGEYDLNDTDYLQELIAVGETCFNLGGADALDSFLENNHISRIDYYNARRTLQEDMGDEFDGFIAELPGAAEIEDTDYLLLPDLAETNEEDSIKPPAAAGPAGSSFQYIYSNTGQQNDHEYEVQNETGQEIDQDTVDSIVSTALNEMGGLGEEYQVYIDEGDVSIHLMNCDEDTYTQEEAQQLFLTEQEQRNEMIKGVITLFRAYKDPAAAIAYLANIALDGDDLTESILDELMDENPGVFTNKKINNIIKDYALNLGIDLFCNIVDELYYDMENINGGDYIVVTVKFEMMTDDGRKNYLVNIRLINQNGEYVYGPENALCYVLPDSY